MNPVKKFALKTREFLLRPLVQANGSRDFDPVSQIALKLAYRTMLQNGATVPRVTDVGFKVCSQTDEDGILLYIFSLIGVSNKLCIEVCAGDGTESNTANLIINHGWYGLLFDGNQTSVDRGREFYRAHPNTYVFPPRFIHAWITRGNINQLIEENGVSGDIDLLSIDVDGVDYWLWDAITVVQPRVVVIEYQDILGPEKAWTVPYRDDFDHQKLPQRDFYGASLSALVKLGTSKGYRLVACNHMGYNAFFVHDSAGSDILPKIEIKDCFQHPKVISGMKERWPLVKDCPWVEV
jgi:hypothetical protein